MKAESTSRNRILNWRCGSSGRVPALQVQNPEFEPQSQTKKEKNRILRPGVVVHAYNSSYLGDGNWKDSDSKANLGKMLDTISTNKPT
jgi:hypothetical protein